MKLSGTLAAALISAIPALVHAQAPARPQTDAPQAVFRSGVELARLDVRIVDGQGLPVKDIKADEVHVLEGGAERPIVLFQHVAEPVGSYLEVARRTIGAEVSTNQGAPRGHLYVFVFDQLHISPGNEARARQAVERFLRTRVKPGDRVALYGLPGPGPQIPFTSNVNIALAELSKVRGTQERQSLTVTGDMTDYEAFQVARGNEAMLQRILVRSAAQSASAVDAQAATTSSSAPGRVDVSPMATNVAKSAASNVVRRADGETHSFLVSLSDVIKELARIEGRKTVVLVSEGFFTDNVRDDVDRVAAAAASAYAVIYSLDVNRRDPDVNAAEPTGADPYDEIQTRLESLGALSAETSGELVLDASPRVNQVLDQLVGASQDYYIVAFEAASPALASRDTYRPVKVTVSRPGARVQARTGYALRQPVNPADRRRDIDTALDAPFSQPELPLEMTTYVLHGTSVGAQRVVMSLEADLPVATDRAAKPADVVFVARDARDGRVRASGSDTIALPTTAAPKQSTGRASYHVQFDLPAGDYLMRVVVREPGGTTGTVDRRFEVRSLDGVDITPSDLVIGRPGNILPVRARAYVDDGLTGALELYARRPTDLDVADVTLDLLPVGGTDAVRSVKADLMDVRRVGSGAGRPAKVAIALNGVPPGDYVVRARIRSQGETVTELFRQVEVVAGAAPAPPPPPPPERVTPKMILDGDLARRFVADLGRNVTDALLKNATAQAEVGAWSSVRTILASARPTTSALPAYHVLIGLADFADEHYGPAAESLQAALALDQKSAPTSFLLGWVHSYAGDTAEALTAWRNAVRLDPGMTSAYLAMADAYVKMSHRELAVQALKDGLAVIPASVELRSKLESLEKR